MKLLYVPVATCVRLFADREGQSIETHWRCYWSWDTSSCRWSCITANENTKGAERMLVVSELDKVTRWVLCVCDNTAARSEGHVPFLPLQLSSNSRLIRIKRGSLFSLAIISEYSYATW